MIHDYELREGVLGDESPYYQAYLLRCWQEPPAQPGDPPADWRFALEKVAQSSERRGFTSLEAVFVFLREALGNQSGTQEEK